MAIYAYGRKNSDFTVGKDEFGDLEVNSALDGKFYYFFNKRDSRLIKHFVLAEKPQVNYVCNVTLIKKGDKFTPRLSLSVRDKAGKISSRSVAADETYPVKASVNLEDCHQNFWLLISFLQSIREIEVPEGRFSLVSPKEGAIVSGLRERGATSMISIIMQLSASPGVSFSRQDVNQLLKRKEKLAEFARGLKVHPTEEKWWQDFFQTNKWIFGYGLNYQILRHEQAQPNYGGTQVGGRGGQKGDYLVSTVGDVRFTVLVEIKTPKTSLLQGSQEIRNGAWSLSKDLTDALSQMSANIATWNKRGSELPENRDRLEPQGVYTVEPKGIIVIGSLSEVATERSKRETVQRFRTAIHGIDIITFDELYNRAKFIAEQKD